MTAPDRSRHIKMILDPRGPSTHATEIFLRVDLESGLIEGRTDEPIRFTEEQIIGVLREDEAGAKTADLARKHGVSEATLYN